MALVLHHDLAFKHSFVASPLFFIFSSSLYTIHYIFISSTILPQTAANRASRIHPEIRLLKQDCQIVPMSTPTAPTNPAPADETAISTQGVPPDTPDDATSALRCAQKELSVAHEALEQVLDVMRRADGKQLQSLFAAAQNGLSQPEILDMVKQLAKDMEDSAQK